MADYIKREDVLQAIAGLLNVTEQIDSADVVEVRHGRWKVVNDGYGDNAYICECSKCKDTVWVYRNTDRKWNYCPNCGARMDGEE